MIVEGMRPPARSDPFPEGARNPCVQKVKQDTKQYVTLSCATRDRPEALGSQCKGGIIPITLPLYQKNEIRAQVF